MPNDTRLSSLRADNAYNEVARQDLDAAMRLLALVQPWGHPAEMTQALCQVGHCLARLAEFEAAKRSFVEAMHWSHLLGAVDTRVDLLCCLAEVNTSLAREAALASNNNLAGHAWRERARDRAFEAAGLAGKVTDPQWGARVLLRVSDVLDNCGDHADATALQNRAVTLLGLVGERRSVQRPDFGVMTAPCQLM